MSLAGGVVKERFQTKGTVVSFCSPRGTIQPTLFFVLHMPMHSTTSGHGTALENRTLTTV